VSHANAASSAERAAIVDGYERMRRKIVADECIDGRVRKKIGSSLRHQIRLKLFEIWAKSLARGDDANALDAARAFRDRYGFWWPGFLMVLWWRLVTWVPPLRFALQAIEKERLEHRAARSTSPQTAASLPAIRKALAT
jgi:hypothetical protein